MSKPKLNLKMLLKKDLRHKLLIIGISLPILVFTATLLTQARSVTGKIASGMYQVTLTGSGFQPAELHISPGSIVRFATSKNQYFWPASNPHPSHDIYVGFDPSQPISSKDTWSFRFDKVGEWRYHNHLNPGSTGIVFVESYPGALSSDNCQNTSQLTQVQKEDCWQVKIDQALATKGVGEAFKVIGKLYETEPLFIVDGCHLQAHRLGEAAYGLYLQDHDLDRFKIDASSVSCGYGFYHGFLEHLFRANPDIRQGQEFCGYLISRLSSQVPAIRLNCYHALGHGFVAEPPDQSIWGNPQAMVSLALQRCEEVSPNKDQAEINECMQGAFNVLGDWIAARKYGIEPPDNSMWLCPLQTTEPRQMACYYELSMRIKDLHQLGIVRIHDTYVQNLTSPEARKLIINNVSAGLIERAMAQTSYNNFVEECLKLPGPLNLTCIGGVIGGIMAQAEPGLEYVKAIKTCAEAALPGNFRDYCYERLGERLRRYYNPDKLKEICRSIDSIYQKHCYE